MTELERFFCRLVETLSAIDPAHLQQPIPLAEIRGSIMPYRSNRRALHLDTSEDYELVLMRLCAGEGGLASISPDEARARFKLELASPNPDLHVLRQFGEATLMLAPGWVAAAMAAAGDVETEHSGAGAETPVASFLDVPHASQPTTQHEPQYASQPTMPSAARHAGVSEPAASAVPCADCGEALPNGGAVKFCPYCGQRQMPAHCTTCGATVEAGWRFCPACGQTV